MAKSDSRDLPLLDWSYYGPYRGQPGHKVAGPSQDAATKIAPRSARLRRVVLDLYMRVGPMSADEYADRIGQSILSIRPRVSELVRAGELEDAGRRGRNGRGSSVTV